MKKDTRGKPSSPQRPSFGKGKPAFGGKSRASKPDARKTTSGSFDKKPRRFDRSEDSAPRAEGLTKSPARFAKKPAFERSAAASPEGRTYGRREDPRKSASTGSFDKKPRRFDRSEESGERAERSERFAKGPSRFAKKPEAAESRSYGRRDAPHKPAGTGSFDRKPRRFDRNDEGGERTERPVRTERTERFAKPASRFESKSPAHAARKPRSDDSASFHKKSEGRPAPIADRAKFRPKRESLQRQGVLLWGLHAVREAWLNPDRKCYRLWATENGLEALESALLDGNSKGLTRPAPLLSQKSDIEHFLPHGTVHQGVVLEVEPLTELTLDDLLGQDEGAELVIILDQVTDPHNVGAILRSAAALGAQAVIVTERNAPGATGTLAKTACGALEHVPLITVVNVARTIETLQEESFWCVGLAEEADHDLAACKLGSGRIALIMGAEGEGLRRLTREHCDELARLPTSGAIGSLNVSNAAAIALYEANRQRTAP